MLRHCLAMARLDLRSPKAATLFVTLLALLSLALVSGCDDGDALECDSRVPCDPGFTCDLGSNKCEPNQSAECGSNDQCKDANEPFCKVPIATCVQCLTPQSLKECGYRGVCDVKETCAPCQGDAECLDDDTTDPENRHDTVCLGSGGCAKETDVAYVSAAGTANAVCNYVTPCNSLASAVATNRPVIRLRGDFTLTTALELNRDVALYGVKEGARTTITLSGAGTLSVSGAGTVELHDLQISGGAANAITVTSGAPKLELYNVDVLDNGGVGIAAGMAALKVVRSVIDNNDGGGISSAGTVYLENNIITKNGGAGSDTGGVVLSSAAAENVIRFNTFGDNQRSVAGRSISCGAATVKLSSNIFAGAGTAAQHVNLCATTHSLFPQGSTVTAPDLAGNPMFLSTTRPAGARDADATDYEYYHLMDTSPAVGKGEPNTPAKLSTDIDGDPRLDTEREIGADELFSS